MANNFSDDDDLPTRRPLPITGLDMPSNSASLANTRSVMPRRPASLVVPPIVAPAPIAPTAAGRYYWARGGVTAPPVPAAAEAASADQPALGTRLGNGARQVLDSLDIASDGAAQAATGALKRGIEDVTLPVRAGAGVLRDAALAFNRQPARLDAGQPVPISQLMPSFGNPGGQSSASTTTTSSAPAITPTVAVAGAPAPAAVATNPSPVAAVPASTAGQQAPVAAAGNADYGLGMRPIAQVTAPMVAAPVSIRGAQGAIIENPSDSTAQKLERALTSASVKGSPSTRSAIAQAILGEQGAAQAERTTSLQAGREADQAGVQANLAASERVADRQMQAQQINANLADSAAGRGSQLQLAQLQRRPTPITAADGTIGMASDSGQYTPITGPDGKPVKTAMAPRQTGNLTQADLLKSYDERYKAINAGLGTPQEKQTQLTALEGDPLYASLRTPRSAKPSLEQFLGAARAANPGVSDHDLSAYYDKTYGNN